VLLGFSFRIRDLTFGKNGRFTCETSCSIFRHQSRRLLGRHRRHRRSLPRSGNHQYRPSIIQILNILFIFQVSFLRLYPMLRICALYLFWIPTFDGVLYWSEILISIVNFCIFESICFICLTLEIHILIYFLFFLKFNVFLTLIYWNDFHKYSMKLTCDVCWIHNHVLEIGFMAFKFLSYHTFQQRIDLLWAQHCTSH